MKIDILTGVAAYKSILDMQKDVANQIIQMLPQNNMQTQADNNTQQQTKTPPQNPDGKISIYA
ncbi:MAG TPA: hypothetical protein EYH43_02485 [Persephonella sp.]|nr:hypothetical protein [Hydrogenothermaceae bacterium]HIQ24832.1 hypothetical protein [Persephonella sp.]